jgi:chromosome segregation ATPase
VDNSDTARVHYKKLKYKTEIAMKQYRKDFDAKVNSLLKSSEDFSHNIEEKQEEVVRLTKHYGEKLQKFEESSTSKEHVMQEVSALEKRMQEQKEEYMAYKAKMEKEEAEFQQKLQEALHETETKLSNEIKQTDRLLRKEINENASLVNLEIKETEEKLEAKVNQLHQETAEQNQLLTSKITATQDQIQSLQDKLSIGKTRNCFNTYFNRHGRDKRQV